MKPAIWGDALKKWPTNLGKARAKQGETGPRQGKQSGARPRTGTGRTGPEPDRPGP